MGGCCSKPIDDSSDGYFSKSKEDPYRFYLQADFIRVKEKHKALELNMKEEFFRIDLKLLPTTGYLSVKLTCEKAKQDLKLNVAVLLVNDKLDLLTTVTKEDTKNRGKTATVSFPMAALVSLNPFISFIVVAVSVVVGDTMVETSRHLTEDDINTFSAWKSSSLAGSEDFDVLGIGLIGAIAMEDIVVDDTQKYY